MLLDGHFFHLYDNMNFLGAILHVNVFHSSRPATTYVCIFVFFEIMLTGTESYLLYHIYSIKNDDG